MAKANGVEELLPPTVKGTEARIQKRAEHGLRVKGTGVGQKVKGKEWERTMKGRLDRRRQAMEAMPKMIQEWKQVSYVELWYGAVTLTTRIERTWSWVEEVSKIGIYTWDPSSCHVR